MGTLENYPLRNVVPKGYQLSPVKPEDMGYAEARVPDQETACLVWSEHIMGSSIGLQFLPSSVFNEP